MTESNKIKVDKSVNPTHFSGRKTVELIIGNDYFVSFGNNNALKCKLVAIEQQGDTQRVTVDVYDKSGLKASTHFLLADEIGLTPEEAVINQVTA